jgi:hypothetical protein
MQIGGAVRKRSLFTVAGTGASKWEENATIYSLVRKKNGPQLRRPTSFF